VSADEASSSQQHAGAGEARGQPSEEELRAAYEAELDRITSVEVMLQTVLSLLNLGMRRMGMLAGARPGAPEEPPQGPADLQQVGDAIDGVRALLDVLERRMPRELGQLREALSRLQIAYAREARAAGAGAGEGKAASEDAPGEASEEAGAPPPAGQGGAEGDAAAGQGPRRPGPAEASGRLWVPGR
jgi:hypothetical protein